MVAGRSGMHVLVSQRVDLYPERGERRDAIDQAWGDVLGRMSGRSLLILPMPNRPQDVSEYLAQWQPTMIVLSGGNDIGEAPERDKTEVELLTQARLEGIPVLAVCRGMQMVQHHLGGKLEPVSGHVACEHAVLSTPTHSGPSELVVNSFHSWGIAAGRLAKGLEALYCHTDGSIEAARHVSLPWLCLMWHPERPGRGMDTANDWVSRWINEVL